ncbi:hypothetical protein Dimus_016984 [Dionaea muscipula]
MAFFEVPSDNPQLVILFLKVIILLLFLSFLSTIVVDSFPQEDDMLVSLFKLVFLGISSISNFAFRIIFTAMAHVVVVTVHGFKVSGEATMWILEEVAGFIKSILEYVVGLVFEATSGILSSIFDHVKDAIVEAFTATCWATGELVGMIKASLEGLIGDVLQVGNGFKEMVATLVYDLWSNYMEAMRYIKDNA